MGVSYSFFNSIDTLESGLDISEDKILDLGSVDEVKELLESCLGSLIWEHSELSGWEGSGKKTDHYIDINTHSMSEGAASIVNLRKASVETLKLVFKTLQTNNLFADGQKQIINDYLN